MNRRNFFERSGKALAGAIVLTHCWQGPRIGYILDAPHTIRTITGELVTCGDGSEYFFAHTAEQDAQLRWLAKNIAPLFPIHKDHGFSKYGHEATGVFVCDDHGVEGGSNYVPFACVILLPGSAGHPAFDVIRKTAERW